MLHDPTALGFLRRPLSRRELLVRGAQGAVALGLAGGVASTRAEWVSASPLTAAKHSLTPVSLQFNYLENVQFAGSYFAITRGYYTEAGLKVTLLPGGPSLAPEPVVASGKALVGVTHTAEAIAAIINGADLKVIGATFQVNPTCITSLASKPVKVPTDLYGKKVGISDSNAPIWKSFSKANNLDVSKVAVVTVGFDVTSLASGEIDALMAFEPNEPTILQLQGVKTYSFLLNDFKYPLMEDIYIARGTDIDNPAKMKLIAGLMSGESRGWSDVLKDPIGAANLAVHEFGQSLKLSLPQQKLDVKAQNRFIQDADTKAHGLFWMTDKKIHETISSLALGGMKATPAMFTNAVLEKVYKGGHVAS